MEALDMATRIVNGNAEAVEKTAVKLFIGAIDEAAAEFAVSLDRSPASAALWSDLSAALLAKAQRSELPIRTVAQAADARFMHLAIDPREYRRDVQRRCSV